MKYFHFAAKVIFVISLVINTNAYAVVKHVSDIGFIVENRIQVQASEQQVWRALVDKVDLWWPKDHSWWYGKFVIDAKAGGCFCELAEGGKSAQHMMIVFVDPNKTLRMLGGLGPLQGMGLHGALDWQILSPKNTTQTDSTEVVLTYKVSGMNPDGYQKLTPIVDKVQSLQLNGLKTYLLDNQ